MVIVLGDMIKLTSVSGSKLKSNPEVSPHVLPENMIREKGLRALLLLSRMMIDQNGNLPLRKDSNLCFANISKAHSLTLCALAHATVSTSSFFEGNDELELSKSRVIVILSKMVKWKLRDLAYVRFADWTAESTPSIGTFGCFCWERIIVKSPVN
jgi:hypothetical protein